ncbi:hypothetical protein R1sor_025956 [Riccia sorocarpa]|uniref:DUF4283 domain-containing protein n=1 Tax=Riccia sorocarpa TaxID=122646 RepID=A0ABD3GA28_9MARC
MASCTAPAGRGAKNVQIARGQTGMIAAVQGTPVAWMGPRPGTSQTLPQNSAKSPPRPPMDYRTAVSPAKLPGINQGLQGSGMLLGSAANYQDALEDMNYGHNAMFSNPGEEYYVGQTQDVANRRNGWGQQNLGLHGQGMMDLEGECFDPQLPTFGRNQSANPTPGPHSMSTLEEDNLQDEEDQTTLPAIPEDRDEELEVEEQESPEREENYLERHKAWVDVLDENLAVNRANPANREASQDFEMDMSELLSAVDDIIETSSHEGAVATDTLFLNTKLFAEGIHQLQRHSLIIHTVDLRVTMSYFEKWAEVTLHQLLGVKVVSMCQLDPFCFHIIMDSAKAKSHIFANSPLKMRAKMVFPLPWDTRFTTKDLKSCVVPVWLELYDVHLGLMTFGLNMLRTIGPIIYAAKNAETQRINIVRGCVLMDLNNPLPEFIPIVVPEAPDRIMKQRIRDNTPPRGNQPAVNPVDLLQQGVDGRSLERRDNTEDFKLVRRRTKPKLQSPEIRKSMKVDNRLGILETGEEEQTMADLGDESVEVRTKPADTSGSMGKGGNPGNASSSSSKYKATNGSRGGENTVFFREVIDLTKGKDKEDEEQETPNRLTGGKHQQEDRDKRLSSVGAITPEESDGRKKLRNGLGGQTAGIPQAGQSTATQNGGNTSTGDLRGRSIRNRVNTVYKNVQVFSLQELKSKEFELENTFRLLADGGKVIVDYKEGGWGGAALIIKPTITVVSSGVRGTGQVAWAKCSMNKGRMQTWHGHHGLQRIHMASHATSLEGISACLHKWRLFVQSGHHTRIHLPKDDDSTHYGIKTKTRQARRGEATQLSESSPSLQSQEIPARSKLSSIMHSSKNSNPAPTTARSIIDETAVNQALEDLRVLRTLVDKLSFAIAQSEERNMQREIHARTTTAE